MQRRRLLRALTGGIALGSAGCIDRDGPEGPGADDPDLTETSTASPTPTATRAAETPTGTDTPAGSPASTPTEAGTRTDSASATGTPTEPSATETPGETPTPLPTDATPTETPEKITGTEFAVTDSGCGQTRDSAAVTFEDEAVTVTGTIWGNDACYTAVLADATLADGALEVAVCAERDADEAAVCADCITEIQYESVVSFDAGLPETVAVVYKRGEDEKTVTTAER